MALFGWDPVIVTNLRGEIDNLFDRLLGAEPPRPRAGTYVLTPPADVYETEQGLVVSVEIPGVSKDEVEIKTESGIISIRAEKPSGETPENEKRRFHAAERSWGVYERAFSVPDYLDLEKAAAELSDGVLVVSVPRREEAARKEIKIQVK